MPAKRFTVEQIVAKLREAERLQGQGQTIPQTCKKLGVSEQTFYRWRTKCGRAPNFAFCDRRMSRFAISESRVLRSALFALS